MKIHSRLPLAVLAALALPAFGRGEERRDSGDSTAAGTTAIAAPAAATATPDATHVPREAAGSAFDDAPPEVIDAVRNAQAIATAIRTGVTPAATGDLARAVKQATTAIVQDSRTIRVNLLDERRAALVRLRAAQTETERLRIVEQMRTQAGQRMEEQRELARLVRDRLRELRETTALTPPGGG